MCSAEMLLAENRDKVDQYANWLSSRFRLSPEEAASEVGFAFMDAVEGFKPELSAFGTRLFWKVKAKATELTKEVRSNRREIPTEDIGSLALTPAPFSPDALEEKLGPDGRVMLHAALGVPNEVLVDLDENDYLTQRALCKKFRHWFKGERGWTRNRTRRAFREVRAALA